VAQSCPHCGIALPAVVDAFCPECRTDLSQTPQEVTDTARRTMGALTGATGPDSAGGMAEYVAGIGRGYIIAFALGGAIAFVQAVWQRKWDVAALALPFAIGGGLAWYGFLRGERTTVSGKSKTSKGPDTPQ
jgi:hypothetical protein